MYLPYLIAIYTETGYHQTFWGVFVILDVVGKVILP